MIPYPRSPYEAFRRMNGISGYRGIGVFGRAYRVMFENDCHADGSVDRVLMENMILLSPETAAYLYGGYTPTQVRYRRGSRPELERHVGEATARCNSDEGRVDGIAKFCSKLGEGAAEGLDAILVGGTEEEIVRRGSDWCSDVARVGCALCQVAGLSGTPGISRRYAPSIQRSRYYRGISKWVLGGPGCYNGHSL